MEKTQCALCEAEEDFQILYPASFSLRKIDPAVFSARRRPDQVHYRIIKCRRCGLVRSHPVFSSQKLKRLYQQSQVTYQKEIPYLKKTYGYYLKKILPWLPRKETLLEIGCANGFFLQQAQALGFQRVYGVEPSQKAVKQAPRKLQKKIINDFFQKNLFPDNYFDLICSFQTLDHLVEPGGFLKEIRKILKPRGCLLLIVHDVDSLGARLFGEKWPIFDIEHLYLFNQKTLKQILIKNQFQALASFKIFNQYPLAYWLRMSPLSAKLKKQVGRWLKSWHLARIPISLPAGNLGLLARKSSPGSPYRPGI